MTASTKKFDFQIKLFPNAPRQILRDLQENGGFAPPEDVKTAVAKIKELEEKNPITHPKKYSHNVLGTKYSYIHTPNDQFFAIYYGQKKENPNNEDYKKYGICQFLLGSGGYGTVKILCDPAGNIFAGKFCDLNKGVLNNPLRGEFVKKYNDALDEQKQQFLTDELLKMPSGKEYENLVTSGDAVTYLYRESRSKKFPQQVIIMKWFPGQELIQFYTKELHFLTLLPRIKIILGILRDLADLHQNKKMLHRDLSLENILIDVMHQVKIIDFNEAVAINALTYDWVGKSNYQAPEIRTNRNYSEQSDIYAIAKCIAALLYLLDEHYNMVNKFSPSLLVQGLEGNIKDKIHAFLSRMLDMDPMNRPAVNEAIGFFEGVEDELTKGQQASLTFVNVQELRTASMLDRWDLYDGLKGANEVVYVDTAERSNKDYILLRNELVRENIALSSQILVQPGADFVSLIEQARTYHDPAYHLTTVGLAANQVELVLGYYGATQRTFYCMTTQNLSDQETEQLRKQNVIVVPRMFIGSFFSWRQQREQAIREALTKLAM